MLADVARRRLEIPKRGVEIALLDWGGEGPVAFCHHANGFCAALWAPIAERLRPWYRVVAMDARGHGDSSRPPRDSDYGWPHFADDLLAVVPRVLREVGRARVALGVGHSFGGTCTALAAAQRPGLFERVAMLDPVIRPPEGVRQALALPAPAARPDLVERTRRRRAVWPSRDAVRAAWSRDGHAFRAWDARSLALYVEEGFRDRPDGSVELKCAPAVEAAVFAQNTSLDPFAFAPRVKAPTLLLRGARGHFPRTLYEAFAARLGDGRVEDLDAGHLLTMEAPDAVADRVLRFAGVGA